MVRSETMRARRGSLMGTAPPILVVLFTLSGCAALVSWEFNGRSADETLGGGGDRLPDGALVDTNEGSPDGGRQLPSSETGSLSDGASSGTVDGSKQPLTYAEEVMSDGPIAYFPLDEASGTTVRDVTGAHPGTIYGSIAYGQTGPFGTTSRALGFDGSTTHIDVPSLTALPSSTWSRVTYEAWALYTSEKESGLISFRQPNGDYSAALYLDEPTWHWKYRDSVVDLTSTNSAKKGVWQHVVVTIEDTGAAKMYVDGFVERTFSTSGRPSGSAKVALGAQYIPSIEDFLSGRLAHIAIYGKVLTTERVLAHYAFAR
jgi:large repetitive protein